MDVMDGNREGVDMGNGCKALIGGHLSGGLCEAGEAGQARPPWVTTHTPAVVVFPWQPTRWPPAHTLDSYLSHREEQAICWLPPLKLSPSLKLIVVDTDINQLMTLMLLVYREAPRWPLSAFSLELHFNH